MSLSQPCCYLQLGVFYAAFYVCVPSVNRARCSWCYLHGISVVKINLQQKLTHTYIHPPQPPLLYFPLTPWWMCVCGRGGRGVCAPLPFHFLSFPFILLHSFVMQTTTCTSFRGGSSRRSEEETSQEEQHTSSLLSHIMQPHYKHHTLMTNVTHIHNLTTNIPHNKT